MDEETGQFSELWDKGVNDGIIGEIGMPVFALLAVLGARMNKNGQCYPSEEELMRKLHKSRRTVGNIVGRAKRTLYRGEPVLKVKQIKKRVEGKWVFSSNMYTISKPIRDNLIDRYKTVGKNLPTEGSKATSTKSALPQAEIPHTGNMPINDSQSSNEIYKNDNDDTASNKKYPRPVSLEEFEKKFTSPNGRRCLEIAKSLGETNMRFIISYFNDKRCGMRGIEWAFAMVCDQDARGKAKNKPRLFSFFIKKYKSGEMGH